MDYAAPVPDGHPGSRPGRFVKPSGNGQEPGRRATALLLPAPEPRDTGPELPLGVPPELVPLAGRPVIAHVIDAVCAAGFSRVVVALPGEDLGAVRAGLGAAAGRCEFVWLESRGAALDALEVAAREAGDGAWLLADSTTILGPESGAQLRSLYGTAGWTAFVGSEDPAPSHPGPDGDARAVPPQALGYLLGPAAAEEVLAARPGGGLSGIGEALAGARSTGTRTDADGWLLCGPGPTRLLAANRELFRRAAAQPGASGAPIELIDAGALVERSELQAPVAIGPGAEVRRARIGPDCTIGADAYVFGAAIEDSIVLPRASIVNSGELIRGCLIGPRGIAPGRSVDRPGSVPG